MRRILTIFLVVLLTISSVTISFAANPYSSQGEYLKGLNILKGDENGDLMLDSKLTREQMVVLISRLYGKENTAANFKGVNFFKDVTSRHSYYLPYILWANNQGLIQGMGNSEFGIGEDVTVQQFQTVLLRALGYIEEAKDYRSVPAKATDIGIMKNLNFPETLSPNRGQIAAMIVNALNLRVKNDTMTLSGKLGLNPLDMMEVATVSNNTVTFNGVAKNIDKLNLLIRPVSSETEDILNLEVALDEDGIFELTVDDFNQGKYEYRYYSGNKSTPYRLLQITNVSFKLSTVKAENLKEIRLNLSKPVDTTLASYIFNYKTTAGSVNNVYFENENKTIVLVLDGVMSIDEEYTISASNIRSTTGENIQILDEDFIATDIEAPKVTNIEILGTKGIRVYFSEPIKTIPNTNNFTLNAPVSLGAPILSYDYITLTYSPDNATLSPGTYTLVVSGLEDYAGNMINSTLRPIAVVKDTTPPEVKKVSGTTDRIIIEFNESIDPISGVKDNVYWKVGVVKRLADKVTIDGNKAIVDFIANPLSTSEVRIYIENMMDYSGNKMAIKTNLLTPTQDLRKPEVLNTRISQDGKSILVIYNKNVIGNVIQNYTITDSTGRIASIKDITGSGQEYSINLHTILPAGLTNLAISGVLDKLNNQIQPYRTSFEMKDLEQPRLINYSGYGNTIIMEFSKPMDIESLNQLNNYIMTFNNHESYLINGTQISLSSDNKTVTLTLPLNIDGKRTMIGQAGNLTALNIRGLEDLNGNFTDPLILNLKFDTVSTGNGKTVDYYNNIPGKQAVLLDANTIKIKFNLPIVKAVASDFVIAGRDITQVIADGTNIVTLRLSAGYNSTNIQDGLAIIPSGNKIQTGIGSSVDPGIFYVLDKASPILTSTQVYQSGSNLEITCSEVLEEDGASLYRRDLQIIRLSDNKVLNSEVDYTTSLKLNDKSTIVISIRDRSIVSKYSIRIVDNPLNIKDKVGNLILPSNTIETIIAL